MRVTLNNINAALAEAGHKERLVKGKGYFYFMEGEALDWYDSSVMVYHLTAYSIDEWLGIHADFKNNKA